MKRKRIWSIRSKLILLIFGVLLLFLTFDILFTSVLTRPYYKLRRERNLNDSFTKVSSVDFTSENFDSVLHEMEERKEIQILVLGSDNRVVYCSRNPEYYFKPMHRGENDDGRMQFKDWLLPYGSSDEQFSIFNDFPEIYDLENERFSVRYQCLLGRMKNVSGDEPQFYYVVINAPMVSVDEGTHTSITLSVMLCLLILMSGGTAALLFANRFTRPIVELCDITQKMARLDFSRKLHIDNNDEMGLLADSINTLSEELEHKINELSQANARLKKDIQELDRVDKKRSELISNISHDLKTPLSIIIGYCEALQSCDNTDDKYYYCTIIEEEAVRMNSLASRLLKLEELESGSSALTFSDFPLSELIKQRLEKFVFFTSEKGIKTSLDSDGDCFVHADYERIEEVVNNLLTNALNFTPDNGTISVTVREEKDGVRCCIYNSGSSIPEESIDRVWESFYMVDKARTRKYGGSGLGLKIVRTIIEAHGGSCGVSNKNDGVEFYFTLNRKGME